MTGSSSLVKTVLVKGLLPVVVLFAGFGYFRSLVESRPQAPQVKPPERVELVEVVEAKVASGPVVIRATGRVKAARETVLSAEVTGRVVEVHPGLVVGGLLGAGETAFRLDDQDYDLGVRQQQAQVTRARAEIQLEAGRRTVAAKEWERLSDEISTTDDGMALVMRQPQLELAKANLAAARSALSQAQLRRDKTTVTVPFNAMVRQETAEEGLLAGPQSQLAHLVGTDVFWVEATVPIDRIGWFDVPGVAGFADAEGAPVHIVQRLGDGERVAREGRVVRLVSELDPLGAHARVIIAVADPLRLAPDAEPGLPLLLNAFVHVEIEGRSLDGAVEVPRVAVRDGDQVWVMGADDRLEVRSLDIVWRDDDALLVRGGVAPGERLVTSTLATPVPGMKVRLPNGGGAPPGDKPPEAAAATTPAAPVEAEVAK